MTYQKQISIAPELCATHDQSLHNRVPIGGDLDRDSSVSALGCRIQAFDWQLAFAPSSPEQTNGMTGHLILCFTPGRLTELGLRMEGFPVVRIQGMASAARAKAGGCLLNVYIWRLDSPDFFTRHIVPYDVCTSPGLPHGGLQLSQRRVGKNATCVKARDDGGPKHDSKLQSTQ
ncbi:hypothetical protein VTK73DRAFT_4319 [Phialemonium thermophilum]|uniref:Uncharacterized protein n=1 Tax=Phialemonium thermophilum TaxID=223376 RepID=A0ABR3WUN3_9PEZI